MHPHKNPAYIHHQKPGIAATVREVVFGMEDGMVSTMGAVTGIAVGSNDHFIVLLAGSVLIAVESISMGIGSYLSSKSEQEVGERMLWEEKKEIAEYPDHERQEMYEFFVADGWSKELAEKMADETARKKDLMLKEMAYRELGIIPKKSNTPARNGFLMWGSYVGGGLIPVVPYLALSVIALAMKISIIMTSVGLFFVGAMTTRFSKRHWWKAGFEMLLLAGLAAFVGYFIGSIAIGI